MNIMSLVLACFGFPVALILVGVCWLWLGLKFVCYVFIGG